MYSNIEKSHIFLSSNNTCSIFLFFLCVITAYFDDGRNKTTSFKFSTYGRIKLGMCEFQPREGLAMKTKFDLLCQNFTAPAEHLKITYGLYLVIDGKGELKYTYTPPYLPLHISLSLSPSPYLPLHISLE